MNFQSQISFVVYKYTDSYPKIDLKQASDQRNKHMIWQKRVIFFFEILVTIVEHKWWCSDLDITIFLQDA